MPISAMKNASAVTRGQMCRSLTLAPRGRYMRSSLSMATLLVAGAAAAQPVDPGPRPADQADQADRAAPAPPVTSAGACEVAIVRAPPEVRRAIESWVHNEASCKIALDVRVIPTADGLYLLARESTGGVHERVVPDAQSAGVLVASWVADASLEAVPPPPRAVEAPLDVP